MNTSPIPVIGPGTHGARQHLAAIAASLSDHGIASRLTRIGGIPVLTVDAPGADENHPTIAIDPDIRIGSELRLDCTCIWTPAPGATPQSTAAIITAVLHALRPTPNAPDPSTKSLAAPKRGTDAPVSAPTAWR